MQRTEAPGDLSDRGMAMVTLVVLLFFSPFILFASSLPFRFVASIVGGSNIGLMAFAFAVPVALLLMSFFVRMLLEIRVQYRSLVPNLVVGQKGHPPALGLGIFVALLVVSASMLLWWRTAFPPGSLLLQGQQVEMRVAKVTQALTHDDSESFYSQQIWLEHVRGESRAGGTFPLLAPRWIDEDRQLSSLQKHSPLYNPGTVHPVWTVDVQNGPFFERQYSAQAFGALLWWLCAGLVILCTVIYFNLLHRFPRQIQIWQDRYRRFMR